MRGDDSVPRVRLAAVAVASAPYRDPFFACLANAPEIDLKVFYLHSQDSMRSWTPEGSYAAETLPSLVSERFYSLPVAGAVNLSLPRRLAEFQPTHLIVYGHSYWSQFAAMRWARRNQVPYFLRCDHTPMNIFSDRQGGRVRWSRLRDKVIRAAAARSSGALTIGRENDRFWAYFGIPKKRRFFVPFSVRADQFAETADRLRTDRMSLRASKGLPTGRLLLYAGRFVEKKNLSALINALGLADRPDLRLVLVGDGPLHEGLHAQAHALAPHQITFLRFGSQSELAEIYAAVDGLVLPSFTDGWGLVVNEAMAAGLPVLVSVNCGCSPDLVRPGENGLLFDPNRIDSIAGALMAFADLSDSDLRRYGQASRDIIQEWSYEAAVAGVRQALEAVPTR